MIVYMSLKILVCCL